MVRHFVVLDFETYWSSKDYTLSKTGPISYVRDPRFHAQMLGICVDDGPVTVFEHDDIPRVLASINPDDPGIVFVGHNINGFDSLILAERYNFRPKRILDTIVLMRWLGMSRVMRESHAAMTQALGNGVKEAGTVISDGKNWPDDFTPEEREAFKQYCADDVRQCRDNLYSLMNVVPEEVINFCSLTARMATEPQFVLDRPALEKYLAELDTATDKARQDLQTLFQFSTNAELLKALRSAKSFSTMLRQLGVEPPMKWSDKQEKEIPALSKTDTEFLDLQEHPDPRVRLLVTTRLEQNTSIHRSRTQTFINLSDKPLPILLSAFRAGTSRYTAGNGGSHDENKSDGTNLQNLSKRNPSYAALRKAVQAPKGYKVVACDSSQVEARLLAYVACQNDLLEIFRNGGDPYSVQASKFGSGLSAQDIHDGAKAHDKKCKMLRNIGKKCILSCIAGTEKVLTDTGWVAINRVTNNHKLWDGTQWVTHQGLMYNGLRHTVKVGGVTMTPDHLIYNGTSWSTAEEYLSGRSSMSLAQSFGVGQLRTCELLRTQTGHGEQSSDYVVPNAVQNNGCQSITSETLQKITAIIAHRVIVHISSHSGRCMKTLRPVQKSAHSLLLNLLEGVWTCLTEDTGSSDKFLCNVIAVENHIMSCSQIYTAARQQDVTLVQNKKRLTLTKNNTGSMKKSALIKRRGAGFLTEFHQYFRDAITHLVKSIATMVVEVSSVTSRTEEASWLTCLHSPAMMTLSSHLIGLITTHIMRQAICALRTVRNKQIIGEQFKNWKQRLLTLKPVYDIKNSGPHHRFLVKDGEGALMVHNCGYGVGAAKFAHSLLVDGVKLSKSLNKHNEQAAQYHAIYRDSNPMIVGYWRRCQEIVRALTLEASGTIGGPNDNMFSYGLAPIPGWDLSEPGFDMPSGYRVWYPNLRAEENEHGKLEYYYDNFQKGKAVPNRIYGSLMTENMIQGLAFQMLAWQACRMQDAGIVLAGNVHDSWFTIVPAAEADKTAELMQYWMSQVPSWLPGFPVACEVEIGNDYGVC